METNNRIASKNIATKVDENAKSILNNNPTAPITYNESDYTAVEAYTIHSGSIEPYGSVEHEVRLWLDESAGNDSQNGTFYSKVVIDARQNQIVSIYKEEILNGADPVVAEGLIPVEIGSNGKVTKADVNSNWYSYEEKKWANAVVLKDENKEYWPGEEIPESNIESYFVWIPKYSYQLWDLGDYLNAGSVIDETKPHVIPVKFGLENTNKEESSIEFKQCTTPGWDEEQKIYNSRNVSGDSSNCEVGDYMTHPAFLSMGTNGLWVGKFETGYKGTTAPGNINDSSRIQIKPDIYSWRNINISNAYLSSYNYKREYDSHMIKNTEWGAVSYLQHSRYGNQNEMKMNTTLYKTYITGYQEENYWKQSSTSASTTGNYSGLYDMSGGAIEFVMGVMVDASGGLSNLTKNGLLSADIAPQYYDLYKYHTSTNHFNRRILGDGTGEFGPILSTLVPNGVSYSMSWYRASAYYIYSNASWFERGNGYIYGFSCQLDQVLDANSFRIVLAI